MILASHQHPISRDLVFTPDVKHAHVHGLEIPIIKLHPHSYDVSKIHLIFRDKSGKNLERKDQIKLEYADKDEYTHLYTLILKADGSYKVG